MQPSRAPAISINGGGCKSHQKKPRAYRESVIPTEAGPLFPARVYLLAGPRSAGTWRDQSSLKSLRSPSGQMQKVFID
jgi:hypothetical protein